MSGDERISDDDMETIRDKSAGIEQPALDEGEPRVIGFDLEVWHDPDRDAWVIRPYRGDGLKEIDVQPTRELASIVAPPLAEFIAANYNADGTCEVYWRRLDGTIGERNTYPRKLDPPESKG